MTKKLRIALIGLGDIAQKAYLPVVANHPKVTPILCTRNKTILTQLADQYRIDDTYDSLAALIKAKPDAIMIHSATSSHFDMAKQSLEAGIAVFVDKPMSYTLAECEQLTALSDAKNQIVRENPVSDRYPVSAIINQNRIPVLIYLLEA